MRPVRADRQPRRQAQPSTEGQLSGDSDWQEEWGETATWAEDANWDRGADGDAEWDQSDTEASTDAEKASEEHEDIRVLKMLYKGNVAEVDRREEQQRKTCNVNRRHDFYRKTRCSSTAHEEQSAMPGGVINMHEDSDDEDDFVGEEKEIATEMRELRASQHWVNQRGWDLASEGRAVDHNGDEYPFTIESIEQKGVVFHVKSTALNHERRISVDLKRGW